MQICFITDFDSYERATCRIGVSNDSYYGSSVAKKESEGNKYTEQSE